MISNLPAVEDRRHYLELKVGVIVRSGDRCTVFMPFCEYLDRYLWQENDWDDWSIEMDIHRECLTVSLKY